MVKQTMKPACCMVTSVKMRRNWGMNCMRHTWLQSGDGVGFPTNHQEDTVGITLISFAISPMPKSSRGLVSVTLHSFRHMLSQLTGDQGVNQVVRVRENDPIQGVEMVSRWNGQPGVIARRWNWQRRWGVYQVCCPLIINLNVKFAGGRHAPAASSRLNLERGETFGIAQVFGSLSCFFGWFWCESFPGATTWAVPKSWRAWYRHWEVLLTRAA